MVVAAIALPSSASSSSARCRSIEGAPRPALAFAAARRPRCVPPVIVRSDVVSQAVGFFSLENGVSVASLVLAAGLPLVAEVAFLFDLLVAVVVFGVLCGSTMARTDAFDRTSIG